MRTIGALLLLALLVACGTETADPGPRADDTQKPSPDGLLTTGYPVTVRDDGDGAELCVGGVDESLPPQCGGPRLIGWDWADHDGDFEARSGVRWGDFLVTGTFDGTDFTPSRITPAAEFDEPPIEADNQFATPCPEPDGGWPEPESSADSLTVEAAFSRAGRLDDYADAWLDTSRDTRPIEQLDQDAAEGNDDVSLWTINVRVTGDPAAAEAELREVWDGALCVTRATYTDRELREIQDELNGTPGMLSTGVSDQRVELGVVYDDGSLQEEMDDRYGVGLVHVGSALLPVEND